MSVRSTGKDAKPRPALIAAAWVKLTAASAILGALVGTMTWVCWLPPNWLIRLWRAAPSPLGHLWLAMLPLVALWLFVPRQNMTRLTTQSCSAPKRLGELLMPQSLFGFLGLSRPLAGPGLLQGFVIAVLFGHLTARLGAASERAAKCADPYGPSAFAPLTESLSLEGFTQHGLVSSPAFLIALFLLIISELLRRWLESHSKRDAQGTQATLPEPHTVVEALSRAGFDAWLDSDEPSASDGFGGREFGKVLAQRMHERSLSASGVLPGLRLVGENGTGKTTASLEFGRDWEAKPSRVTVYVNAWSYSNEQDLVLGILLQLERALSRWDASLAVRGLASEFARAVGFPRSWFGALVSGAFGWLRSAREPHEVIERLDEALLRLDAWVVLWVDDLDRFSPANDEHTPGNTPPSPRPDIRIVASLLHALTLARRVGVVCALSREHFQITRDDEKLFSDTYRIPTLAFSEWRPKVQAFRSHAATRPEPEHRPRRDLAPPGYREDFDRLWTGNKEGITAELKPLFDWLEDEVRLTPRTLKGALRATKDRFADFVRVVDADEYLLLNILKHANLGEYRALVGELNGEHPPNLSDSEDETLRPYCFTLEGLQYPRGGAYSKSIVAPKVRALLFERGDFFDAEQLVVLTEWLDNIEVFEADPDHGSRLISARDDMAFVKYFTGFIHLFDEGHARALLEAFVEREPSDTDSRSSLAVFERLLCALYPEEDACGWAIAHYQKKWFDDARLPSEPISALTQLKFLMHACVLLAQRQPLNGTYSEVSPTPASSMDSAPWKTEWLGLAEAALKRFDSGTHFAGRLRFESCQYLHSRLFSGNPRKWPPEHRKGFAALLNQLRRLRISGHEASCLRLVVTKKPASRRDKQLYNVGQHVYALKDKWLDELAELLRGEAIETVAPNQVQIGPTARSPSGAEAYAIAQLKDPLGNHFVFCG